MKTAEEIIEDIHECLCAGKYEEMAGMIKAYGASDFFNDYGNYLSYSYSLQEAFSYYTQLTKSYQRFDSQPLPVSQPSVEADNTWILIMQKFINSAYVGCTKEELWQIVEEAEVLIKGHSINKD
jgi:hypothetical protein